jgi:N6-adenosine-specific RNA methylase IME4
MIQLPQTEGGFRCVVADPPWPFSNKITRASAEDHYETMTIEEIIFLPVRRIVANSAHLALWKTDAHGEQAHQVARAWGFEPKCEAVWIKTHDLETRTYNTDNDDEIRIGHFLTAKGREKAEVLIRAGEPVDLALQIGLGNYFRHAHESLLFCTRGKAPSKIKNAPSVIFAPREEHSKKPWIVQSILEHMSQPPGIELFARRDRPGWVCWGNDPNLLINAKVNGTAVLL